jgi:hypothetical protein
VLSHEELRFEAPEIAVVGTITQIFSKLCMHEDSQVSRMWQSEFVTNLTIRKISAGITVIRAVHV